jgi:hypothetical protein
MLRIKNLKHTLRADASCKHADIEKFNIAVLENEDSFDTTDGGMITMDQVNNAVDRGAGIFIGNYFVGIPDSYKCYINSPFGRFS